MDAKYVQNIGKVAFEFWLPLDMIMSECKDCEEMLSIADESVDGTKSELNQRPRKMELGVAVANKSKKIKKERFRCTLLSDNNDCL